MSEPLLQGASEDTPSTLDPTMGLKAMRLKAIREAAEHAFRTADIDEMNREIAKGYEAGLAQGTEF